MPKLRNLIWKWILSFQGLGSPRSLKVIYGLLFVLIIFKVYQTKSPAEYIDTELVGKKSPEMLLPKNASYALKIAAAAAEHDLDYSLLSCIFKVESNYRMGVISKTNDYGIGQINEISIKQHKLDKQLLLTDEAYAIDSTAKLLKGLQQRLKSTYERQWPCAYNIGVSGLLRGQKGAACEDYLHKLNSCIINGDYL
jgi:Transglycosylase SLT domain